MSKAVLISIHPRWCEKIASGEKTIEIRKPRPKLQPPFKCYIYCTQSGDARRLVGERGKVIGEFTCDQIYEIRKRGIPENFDYCYLSLNEWGNDDIEAEIKAISASCVSKEELNTYGVKAPFLYGWHIADLKIYDTPRELGEFSLVCRYKNDDGTCPSRRVACSYQQYDYNHDGTINLVECGKVLECAPQSWRYVEEVDNA